LIETLLLDVGPAVGGHGQRGTGRYVRGLVSAVGQFPTELANRIWAMGPNGSPLMAFGEKAFRVGGDPPPGGLPGLAMHGLATFRALRRSGARVFHATDPQRPWVASRVRSLVTVYDLIPLQEPAMLKSWRPDHQFIYRLYLRQVRQARRVLAISKTTAEGLMERLGIAPDRIDIVYPVIVEPPPGNRVQPSEPTFLVVGALDQHKQPELALQAFARFRANHNEGRLRLIGPADERAVHALRALAARLGINDAMTVEGRISDAQLEAAYRSATALIASSRVEGFGLPAVEAVVRSLPVVAVDMPAARETLGGTATLVPADADAIAEAMATPTQPAAGVVVGVAARFSAASAASALALSYRNLLD
jgi:glycosyltransferase involved in cell wall biosynthesis